MNPSDRIKAALSRPEATRRTVQTPTLEPPADVETTLPLLADATRAASSQTPAVASVPHVETAPAAQSDTKTRHARRMFLALSAVVLVAISAVVIRELMISPKQSVSQANLQVVVQRESTGLLSVRWNPQSTPVANSASGRLVILESNQQPKVVQLRADELKIGHVFYESSADRLEFRLEVVDAAGAMVKESVLALPSGPATAAVSKPTPFEPAPVQTTATNPQAKQERQTPAAVPETQVAMNTVPETPKPAQPAPRTFTPPTPTQRTQIDDARPVVLDPSPSLPGGISAPAHVNLPQMGAIPAPAVKAPPQRAATTPYPSGPGGNVQPAALIKKVAPVYPPIARTARVQGTVRFTATIDKKGYVQNIQFVSGPQMLIQAATDAVRKWVYSPMTLNGQPTEVITQIEVRFSLKE